LHKVEGTEVKRPKGKSITLLTFSPIHLLT
jgi:hypothetical protein